MHYILSFLKPYKSFVLNDLNVGLILYTKLLLWYIKFFFCGKNSIEQLVSKLVILMEICITSYNGLTSHEVINTINFFPVLELFMFSTLTYKKKKKRLNASVFINCNCMEKSDHWHVFKMSHVMVHGRNKVIQLSKYSAWHLMA